jgi:hypothetical protein
MNPIHKPEIGETYHCEECGMQIKVIAACNTQREIGPEFRCCGAEMRAGDPLGGKTLTPEAARGDFTA